MQKFVTNLREPDYEQLAVWEGTVLREEDVEDFVGFLLEKFNARIKFVGTVTTPAGRHDVMFLVHKDMTCPPLR